MSRNWRSDIAMYLWHKVGIYPFLKPGTTYKAEDGQRICTYQELSSRYERLPHISAYRHFIDMCDHFGLSGSDEYLSFICTMDYILGYSQRTPGSFRFLFDAADTMIDIVPAEIPDAFDGSDRCHMFSYDAKTNLTIVGAYKDLELSILLSFPEEVRSYALEMADDISESEISELIEQLKSRIAYVKKLCRHDIYKLDWSNKESDEIKYFLRKSYIAETEDNISSIFRYKELLNEDTENAAAIVRNGIRNEKLMLAAENMKL